VILVQKTQRCARVFPTLHVFTQKRTEHADMAWDNPRDALPVVATPVRLGSTSRKPPRFHALCYRVRPAEHARAPHVG
jgi:hypothetical protein